jgi:hypothetical protein
MVLEFELSIVLVKHSESYLQSILLWLFWRWGLVNYLPRLALNCNLPNLTFPNN